MIVQRAGKWVVLSMSGATLGEYETREQAAERLMFELVNEIARRNSANNRVFVRPDKRCVKSKADAVKAWIDAV